MKKRTVTLSKTIKLPIPGVQFSNKVVTATVEFDGENFNMTEAWEEVNHLTKYGQDDDPAWIQNKFDFEKEDK